MSTNVSPPKFRFPDGTRIEATYLDGRQQWVGKLRLPDGRELHSSHSGIHAMLKRLGRMFLGADARPAKGMRRCCQSSRGQGVPHMEECKIFLNDGTLRPVAVTVNLAEAA